MTALTFLKPSLPLPSDRNSPFFDGRKISRFLEVWDDFAESNNLGVADKIKKFKLYSSRAIRAEIEGLESFKKANDFAAFETELKKLFRSQDVKYTLVDLESLGKKNLAPREYLSEFRRIRGAMIDGDQYSEKKFSTILINGLPKDLNRKMKEKLTSYDLTKLSEVEKTIKTLIDEKTTIEENFRLDKNEFEYSRQDSRQDSMNNNSPSSNEIGSLIKEMERLRVYISQMQGKERSHEIRSRRAGSGSLCIYCDQENHIRQDCKLFQEDLADGKIRLNQAGRITDTNNVVFRPNFNKGGIRSLVMASKTRTIRVENDSYIPEIKSETHFIETNSYEKRKREDEGMRLRPRKTSFRLPEEVKPDRQSQEYPKIETKPKQIVMSQIEKDLKDAKQEAINLLGQEVKVPLQNYLANAPNVSKEFIQLLRRHKIDVNVNEIAIEEENETSTYHCRHFSKFYYSVASAEVSGTLNDAKVNFTHDDGSEINVITLSTFKRLSEEGAKLYMDQNIEWLMKNANNQSDSLIGVIHEAEVNIGGVIIKSPVFVTGAGSFEVLLGRPFERASRMKTENNDDGSKRITIKNLDGTKECSYIGCQAENSRNRSSVRRIQLEENGELIAIVHKTQGRQIPVQGQFKKKYKTVDKKVRPMAVPLKIDDEMVLSEAKLLDKNISTKNDDEVRLTDERLDHLTNSAYINEPERALLKRILRKHDKVFAFSEKHKGRLNHPDVMPFRIYTVDHKPWNFPSPRYAQLEEEEIIAMLKDKIKSGFLEYCQSPYSNKWFVFRKKNGSLRFIQDVQELNKVTIRDVGTFKDPDLFSEGLAGRAIYSIVDCFSGYDQFGLDERDRQMLAMNTPIGMVQPTALSQGHTNSVANFQRGMNIVLQEHIPHRVEVYLDDVPIKGPHEKDETKDSDGVRKFVAEHIQDTDQVLTTLEQANLTISGVKSTFCVPEIIATGFICTCEGRKIDPRKIDRVLNWQSPTSVSEIYSFLGFLKGLRMFIKDFSKHCEPLNQLTRKGVRFTWGEEQQSSFSYLKHLVVSDPILRPINFANISKNPIVIISDASGYACGGVLCQVHDSDGRRHPARYESKLFNDTERKYSTIKQECLGVLHNLKKFRPYIFGRRFILEVDAQSLVYWFNSTMIQDSAVQRWVSYIKTYDFEVKHIKGTTNLADGLSRMKRDADDDDKEEIDDFLETDVLNIRIVNEGRRNDAAVCQLKGEYSEEYELIADYLLTLKRPDKMTDIEFKKLKTEAMNYCVKYGFLFRRSKNKYGVPRRVICKTEEKEKIVAAEHEGAVGGHRGVNATFQKIKLSYYWRNMYNDVVQHVKYCSRCQKYSRLKFKEELIPTWTSNVFRKVGVDIVEMPIGKGGFKYIINCRDDFTGFVDGKAIKKKNDSTVAKFLLEFICRYGLVGQIVADNGEVNTKHIKEILRAFGIKVIFTTPFHPQSDGVVERGHRPLVGALVKWLGEKKKGSWPEYLPLAFWADNVSIRRSTGFTPYSLMFGRDAILPIELELETFFTVQWTFPISREQLLANRIRQLAKQEDDINAAAKRLENERMKNKAYHDKKMRARSEEIRVGDLVLLYDPSFANIDIGRKFVDRWLGPYIIVKTNGNGSYRLAELDGAQMKTSIHGNRLKRFYSLDVTEAEIERVLKEVGSKIDEDVSDKEGDYVV